MAGAELHYTSRAQWRWVFDEAVTSFGISAKRVSSARCLPSASVPDSTRLAATTASPASDRDSTQLAATTASPASDRDSTRLAATTASPAPLRVETTPDGDRGGWFSSPAFHFLGDKATLSDTLRRGKCEWAAPASAVVPWDITVNKSLRDAELELRELWARDNAGRKLPACLVLKPSSACGGSGIVYVQKLDDAVKEIDRNAKRAMQQEGLLESLKLERGRVPRWVLQEHIESRLICNRRKFHVRAYVLYNGKSLVLLTGRYEVRIAHDPIIHTIPYPNCNRSAHMTNGAGGTRTLRCMFSEVPELAGSRTSLDAFLRRLFSGEALGRIIADHLKFNEDRSRKPIHMRSLAMCALDIMLDKQDRWWLLEVNADAPGAPPETAVPVESNFRHHLACLGRDLIDFSVGVQHDGWESM